MKQQFLYPQEIEVYYILPAIKRELAITLKAQGKKQKDIALLLKTEDAAISQYLNNKRGAKITLPEAVKKEIQKAASHIKDTFTLLEEMQQLIRFIRTSNVLCQVHKEVACIPACCNPKRVNCFPQEYGNAKLHH